MSGRDVDNLLELIRQIWNKAIEIDGLAHQELKGLGERARDKETYWAVLLKWQRRAEQEMLQQLRTLEALVSERSPRRRRGGAGGLDRDDPNVQLVLDSWDLSLSEFCKFMDKQNAKPPKKWKPWWPGSWFKAYKDEKHKDLVSKYRSRIKTKVKVDHGEDLSSL